MNNSRSVVVATSWLDLTFGFSSCLGFQSKSDNQIRVTNSEEAEIESEGCINVNFRKDFERCNQAIKTSLSGIIARLW